MDINAMTSDEAVAEVEDHARIKQIELEEAFARYDVVEAVHDPSRGSYVIMAEPEVSRGRRFEGVSFAEMGYTSPSPWTSWTREEKLPELRDKLGIRKYYDMKRADGTVRGALRILKTPIQAAEWFIRPASESSIDKNIAKFVEDNLFNTLNVSWDKVIEDVLLMLEYGYFVQEKVYRQDADGKIRLQKLGPRHPLDIREWIYDENGGPDYLVMEPIPRINRYYDGIGTAPTASFGDQMTYQEVVIPINKLLVFAFEEEAGDLRGISVLRSAYSHYYYKTTLYKIDAIQKERHGIGVPIVKLPMSFSQEDKEIANELGRNLRTNERAHVTVPANWDVYFAKLEGQPVDCLPSIKHHDMKIMSNTLTAFLDDPGAMKPDSLDMFYKSTRYIARTIAGVYNKFLIPELVAINFNRGKPPTLGIRRIGEWEDIRTMTFAMRNLVGSKLITPDKPLEEFLREELFLPNADPETSRELAQNSRGGEQGTHEVAPPGEPNIQGKGHRGAPPVGTPQANAGTDRSGGH